MRFLPTEKAILVFVGLCILAPAVTAEEIVPYVVARVNVGGSNFVELIGPGKWHLDGQVREFSGSMYIAVSNMNSLLTPEGGESCVIGYSHDGYDEQISVIEQSCSQILAIIAQSRD